MGKKLAIMVLVLVIIAGGGWWLFRPSIILSGFVFPVESMPRLV